MVKPPVSEQVQVNFRMPVDLRDRIKMASVASGTSMNHLIIETLEEKYPAPPKPPQTDEERLVFLRDMIDTIAADERRDPKDRETHLMALLGLLLEIENKLPASYVDNALSNWTPPPEFRDQKFIAFAKYKKLIYDEKRQAGRSSPKPTDPDNP